MSITYQNEESLEFPVEYFFLVEGMVSSSFKLTIMLTIMTFKSSETINDHKIN